MLPNNRILSAPYYYAVDYQLCNAVLPATGAGHFRVYFMPGGSVAESSIVLCNVNSSKNNDLFRDVLRLFAHLSQVQKTHQIQELMFYAFRYMNLFSVE